jgi:hypothetical protein
MARRHRSVLLPKQESESLLRPDGVVAGVTPKTLAARLSHACAPQLGSQVHSPSMNTATSNPLWQGILLWSLGDSNP